MELQLWKALLDSFSAHQDPVTQALFQGIDGQTVDGTEVMAQFMDSMAQQNGVPLDQLIQNEDDQLYHDHLLQFFQGAFATLPQILESEGEPLLHYVFAELSSLEEPFRFGEDNKNEVDGWQKLSPFKASWNRTDSVTRSLMLQEFYQPIIKLIPIALLNKVSQVQEKPVSEESLSPNPILDFLLSAKLDMIQQHFSTLIAVYQKEKDLSSKEAAVSLLIQYYEEQLALGGVPQPFSKYYLGGKSIFLSRKTSRKYGEALLEILYQRQPQLETNLSVSGGRKDWKGSLETQELALLIHLLKEQGIIQPLANTSLAKLFHRLTNNSEHRIRIHLSHSEIEALLSPDLQSGQVNKKVQHLVNQLEEMKQRLLNTNKEKL